MDRLQRPARTEIAALLKKLAAGPQSTYDQRAFFLGEYLRVLSEFLELPEESIQAGDLADAGYAMAWLRAAAGGYTRQRKVHGKRDAAAASQSARCAAFNVFARHLGVPDRLSEHWPEGQGLPVDESRRIAELLADNRPPRTNRSTWERTSALAALRLSTGRPLSELAGLKVEDLELEAAEPTVVLGSRTHQLDALAVRTMDRWLQTRARLTASRYPRTETGPAPQLEGGVVTAVWVTLKPGRPRHGEPARHPYLPCSIRALRAAQHDQTTRLLARPTRIGQLTRPDPEENVPAKAPARAVSVNAAPPPALSEEAKARALAQAVEVRRERTALLDRLKSGGVTLAEILDRTDRVVGGTRAGRLVGSLPGIGQARRVQILTMAGIGAERRLQGLGSRQRERLLQSVAQHSGQPAAGETAAPDAGDRTLG
ncbi:integration host factor, actinobacterial type [Streptomyces goshikiensis]|uniref:integration host factor, actinobacterial type n=1 Tax=Streptomyces goshikiensis TaxID=1942 RepID=UPI003693DA2E